MDQIWALGRIRREPSRPRTFPFAFPVGRGPVTAPSEFERALGALYGLAIGDALGMPTQLLSPEDVDRRFGSITWFQPAPDDHPIAAGLPAGHVTDDTEQALLIARLLIDGHGRIDPHALAHALADWEREMVRRGSLGLPGPATPRGVSAGAPRPPVQGGRPLWGRHTAPRGAAPPCVSRAGGLRPSWPASSATSWAGASRRRNPCPPHLRSCDRQARAARGRRVSSPPHWAGTATRSRRSSAP